ncbi:MAG: glycerol-3-phosphate 1-O-acyltransferase PlsY [Melioribacteraceae bacterium]|nr:glycerol-3-phosphate 1-O-acyltransferase PlsY [Melioribacteraceae bacterium]MCF8266064.1 glycerol-3-phosphate 1-O-acyltransferase PlsY [Melioribacteraceae bacterium]MCF8411783.1 glycerol-3-phosphate 1-O-acyltransferase PlsY [Melioribacteraceae bacterium]
MLNLIVILVLSYLVGSIPTGIIIGKMAKGIDPRDHGSGSMGATNVLRLLGWKYGVLTIVLDAFKGVLAVVVISRLYLGSFPFPNATPFDDFTLVQILAGLVAVIGHIWTVFAGFKGGKGIATGLGFMISIVTVDLLLALGVFVIVVYFSKYISLGSISAAVSIPIIMAVRENFFGIDIPGYHTILPFCIILALLVIFTHRTNITRLISGNENRVSFSKNKS